MSRQHHDVQYLGSEYTNFEKGNVISNDTVLPACMIMYEGMLMNATHLHELHCIYERLWK